MMDNSQAQDETRRLQEKAEVEAARYRDEKRAAKVRAALPEVPPGVMTFDPRRLRRHARKQEMWSALTSAKREKVVAEHEKRVALQRVAQAERERMKAQAQLAREKGKGFLARVRDVFRRRAV